jgi:hypothetical protein
MDGELPSSISLDTHHKFYNNAFYSHKSAALKHTSSQGFFQHRYYVDCHVYQAAGPQNLNHPLILHDCKGIIEHP